MYICHGTLDKAVPSTSHTVLVISAGESRDLDMFTFRKNGRRDWSLFYCEEGVLSIDETEIHSGQVWIYPPDTPQKYLSLKSKNTTYHYLHFTGSNVPELMETLGISIMTPLDVQKDSFLWILKKIEKSTMSTDSYSEIISEYCALRLLCVLVKAPPYSDKRTMMVRVTEDMSHTYSAPYDASKYAKMFSLSISRFNHLFKEVVGTSPKKYYIDIRMQNACFLIESTDLTIKDIAEKVGYENPLYFSQLFKKHVGVSPSDYRVKH